eukprot:130441-Prorocentrum_minimum.AAC.1
MRCTALCYSKLRIPSLYPPYPLAALRAVPTTRAFRALSKAPAALRRRSRRPSFPLRTALPSASWTPP